MNPAHPPPGENPSPRTFLKAAAPTVVGATGPSGSKTPVIGTGEFRDECQHGRGVATGRVGKLRKV